jgi:DNA (cytosine-5)-methyltransferase 1
MRADNPKPGRASYALQNGNGDRPRTRRRTYSVASLFSGIGGFDLGFVRAGFKLTFQCEVSHFCRAILERHFPDVRRSGDIKEVYGTDIPSSDVWVAGFPCQDVSLARMGKRAGLRGRQSSLFFEFARLVDESRPRVLVVENVPGLLSSHKGRDFGIVLGTLADLGYSVGWRVLNSKDFGVPQSRQRVYIVGSHHDWEGAAKVLFEPERGTRDASSRRSDGETPLSPFKTVIEHPGREGAVTPSIAYCLYAESARHTGTDWSRNYVSYPKKGDVRRLMPNECEGVMSFPLDWTVPCQIEWDDETYDTLRYHALGNAVTPPVAEWLANRIKHYLDHAIGYSHEHRDVAHHHAFNGLTRKGSSCESPFAHQVAAANTS